MHCSDQLQHGVTCRVDDAHECSCGGSRDGADGVTARDNHEADREVEETVSSVGELFCLGAAQFSTTKHNLTMQMISTTMARQPEEGADGLSETSSGA